MRFTSPLSNYCFIKSKRISFQMSRCHTERGRDGKNEYIYTNSGWFECNLVHRAFYADLGVNSLSGLLPKQDFLNVCLPTSALFMFLDDANGNIWVILMLQIGFIQQSFVVHIHAMTIKSYLTLPSLSSHSYF